MPVDYGASRALLDKRFAAISKAAIQGTRPEATKELADGLDQVFASRTQSFREALLGCALAFWCDPEINILLPYANLDDAAFNGRSLDENVVNPFLKDNRVPSSRGPYLAVFRRSVAFDAPSTRAGLRNKGDFDVFLSLIEQVRTLEKDAVVQFIDQLLLCFYDLREASQIQIARLGRISLEQIATLMNRLIATPSGGRFPMYLVEAALIGIRERFNLGWEIEVQGINVSDAAGGAGGDVTVRENGEIAFAAEVTEREVNAERVVATFQAKISPHAIADYLFLITDGVVEQARIQARAYFAQGHEVNFIQITDWIHQTLVTIGAAGRAAFFTALMERLEDEETPTAVKTAWNREVDQLTRT
ncbi:MAG: restriction endonuclease, SacI family [Chloroflexota bacterium]|nr:restriction endonuclease, SacI family [Gemmatimonadota bacterium]MDE2684803.1 restriction endonuclease, SacI family [Chloroflexota bacterium]